MKLNTLAALSFVFVAVLAGCGSGGDSIKPDQEVVNRAKAMREMYNKANGNYDSLSPEDKTKFASLISPGQQVAKVWAGLAPQQVNFGGGGDPRAQGH